MRRRPTPDERRAPAGGRGRDGRGMDPPDLRRTVIIEHVAPVVESGRHAVKREVGDVVEVAADIFKEGHDVLVAFLHYRRAEDAAWREAPMQLVDNDRWAGAFTLERAGRWLFTIEALPDPFASWLADLGKRRDAGQDVASELLEGAALVRAAAGRAGADDRARLE
ncbi:MAG: maltotransferase domain-containing protein, partial [Candidatus Rokuibacteriota bacterium]